MLAMVSAILLYATFFVSLSSANLIHKGVKWNEVIDDRWDFPAGRGFTVSSADEINALQPYLEPGDYMIMNSTGDWVDARVNLSASGIDEEGYRIYLMPDVYGGVCMTGDSQILFHGDNIEVRGAWIDGVSENKTTPVWFEPWSTKDRFTNSAITNFNRVYHDVRHHWIEIWGSYHSIDRCSLEGKKNTGQLVRVKTNVPVGDEPDSWGHYIGWNYFGPRPLEDDDNGEGIQIGLFESRDFDTDTLVEFNFFYKYNGEIECISVKASNNTVRYNTFESSECSITLRHTDRSVVEENYVFCNYRPGCGGVRVGCGVEHVVQNNYIEHVAWKGDDQRGRRGPARGGIVVYTANNTEPKRHRIEHCLLRRNIMVNCSHSLVVGVLAREGGDNYPANNTYEENVLTGRSWDDYAMQEIDQEDPTYIGNIAYRGMVDKLDEYEPGIVMNDPVFEYDAEWEIYRPTNVGFDFTMTHKRLKFDDVGPTWRELDPDKQL